MTPSPSGASVPDTGAGYTPIPSQAGEYGPWTVPAALAAHALEEGHAHEQV